MRLLRRCVTAGWVDFTAGDRPVVVLTEAGPRGDEGGAAGAARAAVARQRGRPATAGSRDRAGRARRFPPGRRASPAPTPCSRRCARTASALARDAQRAALRDRQRPHAARPGRRSSRARSTRCSSVYGIGPAKAERYGRGFLEVIERALGRSVTLSGAGTAPCHKRTPDTVQQAVGRCCATLCAPRRARHGVRCAAGHGQPAPGSRLRAPPARARARLQPRGDRHARPGHRRQQRDLQRDQRGAAPAAARSRSRTRLVMVSQTWKGKPAWCSRRRTSWTWRRRPRSFEAPGRHRRRRRHADRAAARPPAWRARR